MTVKRRSRSLRASTIVTVVLTLGALVFACADERFGLGADCIKDEDCLSNICNDLKCTAAPPILDRDAAPPAKDASTVDVTDGEAGAEASTEASAADTSVPDSGTD